LSSKRRLSIKWDDSTDLGMGMSLNETMTPMMDELIVTIVTITGSPIVTAIMLGTFFIGGWRWFLTGSGEALRIAFGCLVLVGSGSMVKMIHGIDADIEYSSFTKGAGLVVFIVLLIGAAAQFFLTRNQVSQYSSDEESGVDERIDEQQEQLDQLVSPERNLQEEIPKQVDSVEAKTTRKIIVD
jgi:hypothetical protein